MNRMTKVAAPTVIPNHKNEVAIDIPIAPVIQIAAAVLIPRTSTPPLKITTLPRKPIPCSSPCTERLMELGSLPATCF